MATDRTHLRVVAIDGVALEDAPVVSAARRVEPPAVAAQQREIRRMREQLRRLQHVDRGVPPTKRVGS
jgi:hypothetical protein